MLLEHENMEQGVPHSFIHSLVIHGKSDGITIYRKEKNGEDYSDRGILCFDTPPSGMKLFHHPSSLAYPPVRYPPSTTVTGEP